MDAVTINRRGGSLITVGASFHGRRPLRMNSEVKFRRVGIVARLDRAEARDFAGRVARYLEGKGVTPLLEKELAGRLSQKGLPLRDMEADLVVVVGGDGSVLKTIHEVRGNPPIYSINMGLVGFLADVAPEEAFHAIDQVLVGKFIREECFTLSTNLDLPPALNEVRVGTDIPQQMVDIEVSVGGRRVVRDHVDAVIVATTTGSSAYALSAGANVIDPRIKAIVVVPICPLSTNFKPYIIPHDEEVTLRPSDAEFIDILVDGQCSKRITATTEIHVKKAPKTVTFLRLRDNFYERLRRRLRISSIYEAAEA